MGVIEQVLIELTCLSCDASERVSVVGSSRLWENPAGMLVGFNSSWTIGTLPELIGAKCLICGGNDSQASYP